jgi:hypothetical protein
LCVLNFDSARPIHYHELEMAGYVDSSDDDYDSSDLGDAQQREFWVAADYVFCEKKKLDLDFAKHEFDTRLTCAEIEELSKRVSAIVQRADEANVIAAKLLDEIVDPEAEDGQCIIHNRDWMICDRYMAANMLSEEKLYREFSIDAEIRVGVMLALKWQDQPKQTMLQWLSTAYRRLIRRFLK